MVRVGVSTTLEIVSWHLDQGSARRLRSQKIPTEFLGLGFGYNNLGFGFWVLGFGFWVLGFGFLVLGFGFWVLGFGFWVWV